jgi:hypothetical protein
MNAAAVPPKFAVSKCTPSTQADGIFKAHYPEITGGGAAPLVWVPLAKRQCEIGTQGTPLGGARAALISPASCWRFRLVVPLGWRSAIPNLHGLNLLAQAASMITTEGGGGGIVTDKDAEAQSKSAQRETPLTPSAERPRKSRARMTEEQKEEAKDKNTTARRETRNRTPAKGKDKAREANTAARRESRKRVTAKEKRGARAEAQATREDYSWSGYQAFLAKRNDARKRTTTEKRSDAAKFGWEKRRKKNVRVT